MKRMSSIGYYEQLIEESNVLIKKYEKQIIGLGDFARENESGAQDFSIINKQRRDNISTSLCDSLKHPMVKKLDSKLSNAINASYENGVLDNFQAVKEEISRAIRKLEGQIEDEKAHIAHYREIICEIQEEEHREAQRAAAAEEAKRKKDKK